MRLVNLIYFVSPFIISGVLAYLTFTNPYLVWLNYGVWLAMVLSVFIFANYTSTYLRARRYEKRYLGRENEFKIAAFVTSYNEDQEIVKETLLSVKTALKGRGDVFLLDDSTKEQIVEELRRFCSSNNIIYVHREKREGFKAGAINNALRIYGDKYDLVAIFDADQRPTSNFFDVILPYFNDPRVAFVQIPQNYTEIDNNIARGAKFQQEPFLRIIMRGRDKVSAFSLGSGTIFRTSVLKEVGFMDEDSLTEDLATSVKIHSKGYISTYYDEQLIWYGEPPLDASSYIQQQSRWALGYFQSTGKIIRSNLNFKQFFDYSSGFYYWIKEGIVTLIEILAPIIFLLSRQPFLKLDPLLYALAYFPYFFFSVLIFIVSIKGYEYGFKGFLLHQANEYLAFTGITSAFFSYLLHRKVPFKVTPKGKTMKSIKVTLPH
ncbi:MAG: glycosyltransferase family 2 protein, partial [Sulfolobales archaeon]